MMHVEISSATTAELCNEQTLFAWKQIYLFCEHVEQTKMSIKAEKIANLNQISFFTPHPHGSRTRHRSPTMPTGHRENILRRPTLVNISAMRRREIRLQRRSRVGGIKTKSLALPKDQ